MKTILSRFRVEALHNMRNVDVSIENNRLVLVGENGTGKSTIANLMTYFLTRQWNRLASFEFRRIVAEVGGREIILTKELLTRSEIRDSRELTRRLPSRIMRDIDIMLRDTTIEALLSTDREKLQTLSDRTGVSAGYLADHLMRLSDLQLHSEELQEISKVISTEVEGQILYLPTYRRIEQDLRQIFPNADPDDYRGPIRERFARRGDKSVFLELVEFGMEDVELTIQRRLEEVKDYVRTSLSNLTGTYLRDVIRGDYHSADLTSKLMDIDEQTIEPILRRIPQAVLTDYERIRLRTIIQKTRVSHGIDEGDKVVAHFLSQLIDLYRTQQSRESDVREFVNVGNQYLTGKELVYDDSEFSLTVRQKSHKGDSERIQLRLLSSGEKQIVSLFSHIYLSGQSKFFVVIDEPELSLSVPWQKRFLPDILGSQKCSGLIAVTHSPFIFDNELEPFTHSLDEFVEPLDVVR